MTDWLKDVPKDALGSRFRTACQHDKLIWPDMRHLKLASGTVGLEDVFTRQIDDTGCDVTTAFSSMCNIAFRNDQI